MPCMMDSKVTYVKIQLIRPKILMGHLVGCYNAAVALECAAKAYLIMEFPSGHDPMNMPCLVMQRHIKVQLIL